MKRKPPLITITLIFLTVLLGIVSGPLGSAVEFPAALKPYAFPLLLILAIILSIIAVWQYFLQEKTEDRTEHPAQLAGPRDRQIIIARVRATWITGVLEQSLHGAALIALGLRDQPDVLANPLRLVLEEKDQSAQMLPAGTRIIQVYDKAPSGLLILGEPGSGKTTMLLELARDLLNRAETDNSYPLPMVFNLSSWAVKRQPLAEWLAEEMNTMYQVSRRLGQAWAQADQVLPLLDGLDEVAPPYRSACVDAINAFREEHGLVNLVVCSRYADYLSLKQHMLMKSAVVVQQLTEQQIDAYLASAGEQLEAVRMALHFDPVLQELVTTPLMLSVLTLVYHSGASKDLLSADSLVERRSKLFEDYIHVMLRHRGGETRYPAKQTLAWLTWLARQLIQFSLTPFYLERMQPSWLLTKRAQIVHKVLVVLVVGVVASLVIGLLGGLVYGLYFLLCCGLVVGGDMLGYGLGSGLAYGLLGGLVIGLVDVLLGGLSKSQIQPSEKVTWSWNLFLQGVVGGLVSGLVVGVVASLVGGLLDVLWGTLSVASFGLVILWGRLLLLLVILLSFGLLFWLRRKSRTQPSEKLRWSWNAFLQGLFGGLLGGLFFGSSGELAPGLLIGLLCGGLLGGLSDRQVDEHNRLSPNQGIQTSGWNALRSVLVIGLVPGLAAALVIGAPNGVNTSLPFGLLIGLVFGLVFGGAAYLQHYCLRYLLWRGGAMPWCYVRFLDYAAERILLRKVGGGYIFVHRLLLEHFAARGTSLSSSYLSFAQTSGRVI